jgi:hypothetical protein
MHRSELAPPADMPSSDHRDPRRLGRIAAIRHIAFVTPGNYPEDDPGTGLEAALRLFERGEALGFDSAWVRSRHLERAISSAATFLAAASQRTRRIRLGTAVIQLGYENPFRLAEDLATVDLLSKGRLEVGVSAGAPTYGPLLGDRLFEGDPAGMDFSYDRAIRFARQSERRLPRSPGPTHIVTRWRSAGPGATLFSNAGAKALVWRGLAALSRMGGTERLQLSDRESESRRRVRQLL